jgi:hypothetical protein
MGGRFPRSVCHKGYGVRGQKLVGGIGPGIAECNRAVQHVNVK